MHITGCNLSMTFVKIKMHPPPSVYKEVEQTGAFNLLISETDLPF